LKSPKYTTNTTDTILKRLEEFLQTTGDTLMGVTEAIGVSRSYFSTARINQSEIGVDKIIKILSLYPQLSGDWLLTGLGFMYKAANSIKDQSDLLAGQLLLKTSIEGIDKAIDEIGNLQNQLRQLRAQVSKTKPKTKSPTSISNK
jgi:hypothetical protein